MCVRFGGGSELAFEGYTRNGKLMKRAICLILLLVTVLGDSVVAAGKNKGPFIGMHPEGSEDEGPRMVRPDTVGGQNRWFRTSPEISGRHFGAYTPFVAQDGNGMGAVLFLNEEGMRAAMVMCSTFNGKLARILVNGRPVDTVRIDRPPSDRKIVVVSGLTLEDFKAFDKSARMKRIGGSEIMLQ